MANFTVQMWYFAHQHHLIEPLILWLTVVYLCRSAPIQT